MRNEQRPDIIMEKPDIIIVFKQKYLRNEPLDERYIYDNDQDFYQQVLTGWGSWHKFRTELGLLERHLKERERYFLYLTMVLRVGRFNEEVLRHKNIEPEMKDRIVEAFGSVRHLVKDIIEDWGPEKILYDVHTYLITGGLPKRLVNKRPMLYKRLLNEFDNEDAFYDEYKKRFWLDPRLEFDEETLDENVQDDDYSLLGLMVSLGYMSETEADNVRKSKEVSEIEVLKFVKTLPEDMTESDLANTNQKMWLAIKQQFGSLENAISSAMFVAAK